MIDSHTSNAILEAMITPAVLISASGTLLLSTSNRLGRVVDRIRVLADQVEAFSDPNSATGVNPEKQLLLYGQLAGLSRRIYKLQGAITVLYAAIGVLVATSISIGVSSFMPHWFGVIPVGMALAGGSLLLFGSVVLVSEARLAVQTTLEELNYVKNLVSRRPDRNVQIGLGHAP